MPIKTPIAANQITDDLLLPHLRRKQKGISYSSLQVGSTQYIAITAECGEAIELHKLVSLKSDGKFYIADAVGGDAAIGIAVQSGNIGDTIEAAGLAIISKTHSFNIGINVFLGENGEITEAPLDGEELSIIQKVGIISKENEIYIKVESPYYIEI